MSEDSRIEYLSEDGTWRDDMIRHLRPMTVEAIHHLLTLIGSPTVSFGNATYRIKPEPVEITSSLTKEQWGLLLEYIYTDEARELRWRLQHQMNLEF